MKTPVFISSLLAAVLFGASASGPVFAQHAAASPAGQATQSIRERIDHGVASGRIAPQEARELYRREREIRFMEIAMKRDGAAYPDERRQLRQEREDLSRQVERTLSGRQVPLHRDLHAPGIERGKEHVRDRISAGLRSGHITRREAHMLYQRERDLAQQEAAARADGVLSPEERRRLRSEIALLGDEVDRMIGNHRRLHAR